MANYKGHTAGGVIAGSLVAGSYLALKKGSIDVGDIGPMLASEWQLFLGLIVIAVLFALWPDVDTNSKAQNIFFGVAFIVDILLFVYGYYQASALLGLLAMTPIIGHHRGWTHKKYTMLLLPAPILIIPYLAEAQFSETGVLVYVTCVAGYFSHLLLDGLIFKHFRIKGGW